jgi:hypothetical protein
VCARFATNRSVARPCPFLGAYFLEPGGDHNLVPTACDAGYLSGNANDVNDLGVHVGAVKCDLTLHEQAFVATLTAFLPEQQLHHAIGDVWTRAPDRDVMLCRPAARAEYPVLPCAGPGYRCNPQCEQDGRWIPSSVQRGGTGAGK